MSRTLEELLTPPPGTWSAIPPSPNYPALIEGPHIPVAHVVLATPVGTGAGGNVRVEIWAPPILDGAVDWDIDAYPNGRARIQLPADTAGWKPGPDPDPAGRWHGRVDRPASPTVAPEGMPYAVMPGTAVAVYSGFADPADPADDSRHRGSLVFAGYVDSVSAEYPGGFWELECVDWTGMLDRVSFRNGDTIGDYIRRAQDGPDPDGNGNYQAFKVVRSVMREAAEFFWPNDAEQLQWGDGTGHYIFTGSEWPHDSWTGVAEDTVIGGRSCWDVIEEIGDVEGFELGQLPSTLSTVRYTKSEDYKTYTTSRRTIAGGPGGTLIDYRSEYTPTVNRIHYDLHYDEEEVIYNSGVNVVDGGLKYFTCRVTRSRRRVTIELSPVGNAGDAALPSPRWALWEVDWGDGAGFQAFTNTKYSRSDSSARVWNDQPGKTCTVVLRGNNTTGNPNDYSWQVNTNVDGQSHTHGFWNRYALTHPSGVRRVGRRVWVGEHRKPRRWAGKTNSGQRENYADDAAARMARRVIAPGRTSTLTTITDPWLRVRDQVTVTPGRGIPSEKQLIRAVSLPLVPGRSMLLVTNTPDFGGATGDYEPSMSWFPTSGPIVTGLDVAAEIRVIFDGIYYIDFGDGTVQTMTRVGTTNAYTAGHTYAAAGTYTIIVWSNDYSTTLRDTVTVA